MEGFYKANEYASMNPNFLCCTENALGIRDWLESQGHEYVVTDDKEVPKWPKLQNTFRIFTFSSSPHSTHLILPKKQSRRFKTYILSQQELGLVILYGWSHG